MAITVVATAGSATANSFASEAQAIARAATRLNLIGWTTVSGSACTEDEKKALLEATRELSALEPVLQGYRTDAVQALCFPRQYVINTKAPITAPIGISGFPEFADDSVPDDWINATIELAFEFLKAGTVDLAAIDRTRGVIQKTIGPLTTRWATRAEGGPAMPTQGIARFPRVLSLVAPFFSDALMGHAVARS